MADRMIRAMAAGGQIRAFAADTAGLTEYARVCHGQSPVATAALGRLMTGTLMMGAMMKDERDLITVKAQGDGPIKSILATADNAGHVKGYCANPEVMLPAKNGKLDVGGALGVGLLTVIRDTGMKEPYVGTTILVSGEIAEDLTYYFASSEQTPSAVALGVLMNRDNTVRRAGGFIIQLMPGASDELAGKLEERLAALPPVTAMLDGGKTPEDMLFTVLDGMEPEIFGEMPVSFRCSCSKDRMKQALIAVGRDELRDMIREGRPVEMGCSFCSRRFTFDISELSELEKSAEAGEQACS